MLLKTYCHKQVYCSRTVWAYYIHWKNDLQWNLTRSTALRKIAESLLPAAPFYWEAAGGSVYQALLFGVFYPHQ